MIVDYGIFLVTKFGIPEPWSAEYVQSLLTQVKIEIHNKKIHGYTLIEIICSRKPLA